MKRKANSNKSEDKPLSGSLLKANVKAKRRQRKVKIAVEGATEGAYLTKRVLVRAVSKGFKVAAERAMSMQGFNVIAENGWVVKVYADGRKEQIKKIAQVKRPRHIALS